MAEIPTVRYGIDWDDDGFINKEAAPGHLLNLIPKPLYLSTVDITPDLGCKITRKNVPSLYGINSWEIAANTSSVQLISNPVKNKTHKEPIQQGAISAVTSVTVSDITNTNIAVGDEGSSRRRTGQQFVFSTSGVITQFTIKVGANVGSPTGKIRWQIVGDSANTPTQQVFISGQFTPTVSSVNTINIPPTLLAAGTYWLVFTAVEYVYGSYFQLVASSTGSYGAGTCKDDLNDDRTWSITHAGNFDLIITITAAAVPAYTNISQKFTTNQTNTIDKILLQLLNNSGGSATVTVRIETDSGGSPSGTLVHANATAGVAIANTTSTFFSEITFDYTNFSLAAGTYWIVITSTADSVYVGADKNQTYGTSLLKRLETIAGYTAYAHNIIFSLWGIPSASAQGYFGKDAANVANDIPASASTSYTWSVWLRGISGYSGDTVTFEVFDQSGNSLGSDTGTLDGTGAWTRFDVTASTGVGDTHIYMFLKIADAAAIFQATGFMMLFGAGASTQTAFNAGISTNLYDNITSTALSANWKLGRANPEDVMFAEGTASLTLDNSDKRYSPEYASSPLFGFIKPNLRFEVELQRPSTLLYETVWSGWTSPIQPEIGEYRNSQAQLSCTQGKFRLDNVPLRYPITANQRTDQIIDGIISSGWFSASTPYVTILDRSHLDENTYMHSLDDVRETATADSQFAFAGENWKTGETKASSAIGDIMSIERGYIWINRSGKLVFRNRHYYGQTYPVDKIINIDLDANDADYHYGDEVYNEIKVTYYPKETQNDVILWKSKETIKLKRGETKTITAKFEYEEGTKITATALNDFNAAVNPSLITAVNSLGQSFVNLVSTKLTLKNGEAEIKLKNSSKYLLTITITIKGDSVLSSGSTAITVSDQDSVTNHGLYEHQALNIKDLTDPDLAEDLGRFIIERFKEPFGTFASIQIRSRDTAWMTRILDVSVGKLLSVSETQTAADDKLLIVVGENMSWTPGILTAEYITVRPEIPSPWILGTSALDVNTYLGY